MLNHEKPFVGRLVKLVLIVFIVSVPIYSADAQESREVNKRTFKALHLLKQGKCNKSIWKRDRFKSICTAINENNSEWFNQIGDLRKITRTKGSNLENKKTLKWTMYFESGCFSIEMEDSEGGISATWGRHQC